jgi:hypothetical protein
MSASRPSWDGKISKLVVVDEYDPNTDQMLHSKVNIYFNDPASHAQYLSAISLVIHAAIPHETAIDENGLSFNYEFYLNLLKYPALYFSQPYIEKSNKYSALPYCYNSNRYSLYNAKRVQSGKNMACSRSIIKLNTNTTDANRGTP